VVQSVASNLSLQTFAPGAWRPSILKTEASNGVGIDALWAEIGRFREHSGDRRQARQRARQDARVRDLLAQRFLEHVEAVLPAGELDGLVDRVARRDLDPYTAVDSVMKQVLGTSLS
jgi:LAO/AO transport system kinase